MPSRCTENPLETLTAALSLGWVPGLPFWWDVCSFSLTLLSLAAGATPTELTQHCFPPRGPSFSEGGDLPRSLQGGWGECIPARRGPSM